MRTWHGAGSTKPPTYPEIRRWVRAQFGYVPATAWIAHVKTLHRLRPHRAVNRKRPRANPCPPDKQTGIEAALRHFRML